MPAAYEIDATRELVIVTFTGDANLADAEAVMDALYADPRHTFAFNRIFDCRAVTRLPPLGELRSVADLFRRRADKKVRPRRAIVVSPGAAYGLGRMIQALFDLAGVELSLFTDMDEAVEWVTSTKAGRQP